MAGYEIAANSRDAEASRRLTAQAAACALVVQPSFPRMRLT
jgi:hypothetical protein